MAKTCTEFEAFKHCCPEEDIQSIINKLGSPIFKRMKNTTLLTYTEHELDEDHKPIYSGNMETDYLFESNNE